MNPLITAQACWFCDKACAKRAWGTHKLYCTDDPARKRHVAVEMTFERILARIPRSEPGPDDAHCYVCLEGGGLVRSCACRGPSAGFAHVDCLAEVAAREEWMAAEGNREISRWIYCAICHQPYTDALRVRVARSHWRLYRDNPDDGSDEKRQALGHVASTFKENEEHDTAHRLAEDATRALPRDDREVLLSEIQQSLSRTNPAASLENLLGLRARVARCEDVNVRMTHAFLVGSLLCNLGRAREALEFAEESVELARSSFGPESSVALNCAASRAEVLARVGRVQEARAELSRVLAAQTRILGANHNTTLRTKDIIANLPATST